MYLEPSVVVCLLHNVAKYSTRCSSWLVTLYAEELAIRM